MVATFPTQHPFPVAPGGMRHSQAFRPLSQNPRFQVRQPDLGRPPNVVSIGGFGSNAGANIRNNGSDADMSQGLVAIRVGVNPTPSGTIKLNFPAGYADGFYVFLCDWATLTMISGGGSEADLTWTATRPLLPNENLTLAYQWAVSQ